MKQDSLTNIIARANRSIAQAEAKGKSHKGVISTLCMIRPGDLSRLVELAEAAQKKAEEAEGL